MEAAAQASFAELEYGAKKRKTRREKFLERMERLVPWKELEKHDLGEKLMDVVNASLAARGLTLREGTVVDASIVAAPTSTKNRRGSGIRRCIRRGRGTSGTSG